MPLGSSMPFLGLPFPTGKILPFLQDYGPAVLLKGSERHDPLQIHDLIGSAWYSSIDLTSQDSCSLHL